MDDHRFGVLTAITANLHSTKHDWKPSDFFPPRSVRPLSLAEKARGLFRGIAKR